MPILQPTSDILQSGSWFADPTPGVFWDKLTDSPLSPNIATVIRTSDNANSFIVFGASALTGLPSALTARLFIGSNLPLGAECFLNGFSLFDTGAEHSVASWSGPQTLNDPELLELPLTIAPGTYDLSAPQFRIDVEIDAEFARTITIYAADVLLSYGSGPGGQRARNAAVLQQFLGA